MRSRRGIGERGLIIVGSIGTDIGGGMDRISI